MQKGGAAAATSHEDQDSKITVLTTANSWKPTLEMLLESCKKHKFSYLLVGIDAPWKGMITKMENYVKGVEQIIEAHGPRRLVLCVDGYDTLVIKDSDKLLNAYANRSRKMPIVVGVETGCVQLVCNEQMLNWYVKQYVFGTREEIEKMITDDPDQEKPFIKRSRTSSKPLFLNSGLLLGPAEDVLNLYKGMLATGIAHSDQLAMGTYLKDHLELVDLDYEEAFFRNKIANKEKVPDEDDAEKGPYAIQFPGNGTDEAKMGVLEKFKAYK